MTAENQRREGDTGRSFPVPDPTQRTIEVLEREMTALNDQLGTRVSALSSELHSAMVHRAELTDSKFDKVDLQFTLAENSRIEQKSDTKQAVVDALAAQKEAVKEQTIASDKAIAKSEAVTIEALKQLQAAFSAATDGDRRIVNDLKERIGAIEAARHGDPMRERIVGMESQKAGAKDNTAAIIASIAVAGVIVSIMMSAISMFAK